MAERATLSGLKGPEKSAMFLLASGQAHEPIEVAVNADRTDIVEQSVSSTFA